MSFIRRDADDTIGKTRYSVRMRRALAIFLSVLCITLPLHSGASAGEPGAHCPHMNDAMQNMNTTSDPDSQRRHDCCNDATTAAKTGQLCKTGQDCSASLSYALPPAPLLFAITTQATSTLSISPHTLSGPPGVVWRPPTHG